MYCTQIITVFVIACISNTISISLNGQWKGYILSSDTQFIAKVPGGVYSDAEKAHIIPDNLKGFNDVNNRWIAKESIAYITDLQINVHDELFNATHVILTFHGLDTFAKIYVNNIKVGETSNMFLKYNIDIKKELKTGQNELKVVFESAVKVAEQLYNTQSVDYIVPPKCVPDTYRGECHVNFIRKMHSSFGWDWGAAFPSMGIWRDVELQPVKNALVTEVTTDILKKSDKWEVLVTIFLEIFEIKNGIINEIDLFYSIEGIVENNTKVSNIIVKGNQAFVSAVLYIDDDKVEKWWPNGYGNQSLYLLNVKVKIGCEVIDKKLKIGFRTVELVQKPLKQGLSFYFMVNEIPIFAKGTNWIPSSVLAENLTNIENLKYLLKASKDSHMNMMRVWGGGVYESNEFYSLADEYGIMIWQDFMFACNMYPTTETFLSNVRKEVVQNMRRLKYHPSIVLWAGNNENEAALYENWYGTGSEKIYQRDYVKLYVDTIKKEVEKTDKSRPFVVSSPSNGIYSEQEGYTNSNPYSKYYGDFHYYNYLTDSWDINQYPVTRFVSEYGFQSLPSIWTLMSVIRNRTDLSWKSSFLEHRQHLASGYFYIELLINKIFTIPKNDDKVAELMNYIYLNQVIQAVAMRIETERYRQMKSLFDDTDKGMTMGALYWQLNDVWQAPSWSSIDYEGRWKMLHYYVKEFFAPVIVTPRLTADRELEIYVVSDLLQPLHDVTVELEVYQWLTSKSITTRKIKHLEIGPNESKVVKKLWLDKFLEKVGCGSLAKAKENCFIELSLKNDKGEIISPLNYVYPTPFKNIQLPRDSVQVKIKPRADEAELEKQRNFEIEVKSGKIALFVWLELGRVAGHFSENGFHILKGNKTVIFQASKPTTVNRISSNLIVTSLSHIYDPDSRQIDAQIVTAEIDEIDTTFLSVCPTTVSVP